MSGAATAAWVGVGLAAVSTVASLTNMPKAPNVQAPPPPPKPQAAQLPDQRAGRDAAAAVNPATQLTGAGGVALGSGQIGKNTLLGG